MAGLSKKPKINSNSELTVCLFKVNSIALMILEYWKLYKLTVFEFLKYHLNLQLDSHLNFNE